MLTFGAWWPRSTSEQAAIADLARAQVAGAPVVQHRRVERRLVALVLDEQPPARRAAPRRSPAATRRSDRPRGGSGSGRGSCRRRRSRRCASVAPSARADGEALEVVLDRLPPHRGVGVAQAAELVGQRLARLILERVRVHRLDRQPELQQPRADAGGVARAARARLVPRDVQRDARRDPDQRLDDAAVVQLLEQRPRLARTGEAREARAAGADAPRRDGDAEGRRPRRPAPRCRRRGERAGGRGARSPRRAPARRARCSRSIGLGQRAHRRERRRGCRRRR